MSHIAIEPWASFDGAVPAPTMDFRIQAACAAAAAVFFDMR